MTLLETAIAAAQLVAADRIDRDGKFAARAVTATALNSARINDLAAAASVVAADTKLNADVIAAKAALDALANGAEPPTYRARLTLSVNGTVVTADASASTCPPTTVMFYSCYTFSTGSDVAPIVGQPPVDMYGSGTGPIATIDTAGPFTTGIAAPLTDGEYTVKLWLGTSLNSQDVKDYVTARFTMVAGVPTL